MSLADRLRAESRTVPAPASPAFLARTRDAIRRDPRPAEAAPESAKVIRLRFAYAAAAVLVAAVTLRALLPGQAPAAPPLARAPTPPPTAAPALAVPVPPALEALVAAVPAQGPMDGEIAALGRDLAAAAQAVRGAVPF